ncbi:MAG: hypothetical protein BroJett014_21990 [Planctomycetota bacterium]|nr:MAG: hypothetical protein BroJett014_21990 [Planctomycetota bacterium]
MSLKAITPEGRSELVKKYVAKEKVESGEAVTRGGPVGFDMPLIAELDGFLERCKNRLKLRTTNPKARKQSLSKQGCYLYERTVGRFRAWLVKNNKGRLTTGNTDGSLLEAFFEEFATEDSRLGHKVIKRSSATIGLEHRNLRVCFRFIDSLRPQRFRDFQRELAPLLKPSGGDAGEPKAFKPSELTGFLRGAMDREAPGLQAQVKRTNWHGKNGEQKRTENFTQTVMQKPSTPVSRLFLLLALTGARLGEILNLKWEDCDLERGRITIHAQKTGRVRIVPLIGAPEGDIAPELVKLMARWKRKAGKRVFVLPHKGLDAPLFPKSAWQLANGEADRIGPQMLRQNFTSYAASLGIPAAVAALWQGHAANVAEHYYRAQVLDRQQGKNFEQAMGLSKFISRLLGGKPKQTDHSKVAGRKSVPHKRS